MPAITEQAGTMHLLSGGALPHISAFGSCKVVEREGKVRPETTQSFVSSDAGWRLGAGRATRDKP